MTLKYNADFFFVSAKTLRLIRAFSLKRNLRTLLNTESDASDITCVNGIRALNALALIVFHKSAALQFNPYINRTYMTEVKHYYHFIPPTGLSKNKITVLILSDNYPFLSSGSHYSDRMDYR